MKLLDKLLKSLKKLLGAKTLNAAETRLKLGLAVDDDYWLFATPVHLVLQRDSFSMAEPLILSNTQHASLLQTLNAHFTEDGLAFSLHENTWFLNLKSDPQINTVAPQNLVNRDIQAYLPSGVGAAKCAQLTNEIQMLLFEHAVNIEREQQKLLPVNSVWFHGLGHIKND